MAPEQLRLFLPLVERYYERVAAEDLVARAVPDLFGAALTHLRLARHRAPAEPKVAVFSPSFDEDGFASPHTVVQVVADDMPFLPDSLTAELTRHGFGLHIAIHPVFVVERSPDGDLLAVLDDGEARTGDVTTVRESFHHIEIDRQADADVLDRLRLDLIRVLGDVRAANEDQAAMRERAVSIADSLDAEAKTIDSDVRTEAAHFLRWLADNHFMFLGYRDYELVPGRSETVLQSVTGSGLGILRNIDGKPVSHPLSTLPPDVRRKILEPVLLNLTKANSRATVQRANYLDYIGIKRFDARRPADRRAAFPRAVPEERGQAVAVRHPDRAPEDAGGAGPRGRPAAGLRGAGAASTSWTTTRGTSSCSPGWTTCTATRSRSSSCSTGSGCGCGSAATTSGGSSPASSTCRSAGSPRRSAYASETR